MPTYIYLCEEEHGEFEIEHKISEKLEECPHCAEEGKETPLTRLIAGGSFQLLGNGWFKDGY